MSLTAPQNETEPGALTPPGDQAGTMMTPVATAASVPTEPSTAAKVIPVFSIICCQIFRRTNPPASVTRLCRKSGYKSSTAAARRIAEINRVTSVCRLPIR